jgi:hypothetical protein
MAGFNLNLVEKKYYRMDEKHKPNQVISRIEKSTAQIYFQLKTGHALIGPYLKQIQRTNVKVLEEGRTYLILQEMNFWISLTWKKRFIEKLIFFVRKSTIPLLISSGILHLLVLLKKVNI